MLSKAQNKYIRSLTQQKYRNEYKVFPAVGAKIVEEWLCSNVKVQMIIAVAGWLDKNTALIARHPEAIVHIVSDEELTILSGMQTPNQVMIVVPMPATAAIPEINEWCIALDGIQDPGNMGTIIRIADWFGIKQIVCGANCVDIYNPKVVQSAMGSHLRVTIYDADLNVFLTEVTIPRIAATLGGDNIYTVNSPEAGVLIIGNESKGISAQILKHATQQVMIPRRGGAESLNAAVSTGILCALLIR